MRLTSTFMLCLVCASLGSSATRSRQMPVRSRLVAWLARKLTIPRRFRTTQNCVRRCRDYEASSSEDRWVRVDTDRGDRTVGSSFASWRVPRTAMTVTNVTGARGSVGGTWRRNVRDRPRTCDHGRHEAQARKTTQETVEVARPDRCAGAVLGLGRGRWRGLWR